MVHWGGGSSPQVIINGIMNDMVVISGYISASGTGSAVPTVESEVSGIKTGAYRGAALTKLGKHIAAELAEAGPFQRFARRLGAAMVMVAMLPAASPVSSLDLEVTKVRSEKGMLRVCLTADPDNFPGCLDDANAVTRSVDAGTRNIHFRGLAPGDYAISVIHDENGNARLDTFAGIPREGFGFSRNPAIGFGPPRFSAARFELEMAGGNQEVRMRYLL